MIGNEVPLGKVEELLQEEGIRTKKEHALRAEIKAMKKGTCLRYPPAAGLLARAGVTLLVASIGPGYRVFDKPDALYVYRES